MPAAPTEHLTDLIRRGDWPLALPLAEAACSQRPDDAGALVALGVLLRELGHYPRAEAPLLRALSLRAASLGKEHPDYAAAVHELGRLYEETGQFSSAEKLYRAGLAVREAAQGPDHPDTATSRHDLGMLLEKLGCYAEGRLLAEQALTARRRALTEDHPETAMSLAARAWILCRRGRLREADQLGRQASDTLHAHLGPEHPDSASAAQLRSRLALHLAQFEEAERLARGALLAREARLGDRHYRSAGSLLNLALVLAVRGRHDEAEGVARRGLEVTRAALGERHTHVADAHAALAYTLKARRDHAGAEPEYLRAMGLYAAAHGDQHPNVAACCRDLAECCACTDRPAEAEEYQRRALAILERQGDHAVMERVELSQALARVLAAQNRVDEAVATARQAVELARAGPEGEGQPLLLAAALDGLARVSHGQGRLAEAEPAWLEALQARAVALGESHPHYADTLRCLAGLYTARGDFAKAQELEDRAVAILKASLGEGHPDYARALQGLAELNLQKGDLGRAEMLLVEAARLERGRAGAGHPDHAHALSLLARLYLTMQNFPAAEVRYRQVIDILERAKGEDHPDFAGAVHDLGTLYHQAGELQSAEGLYARARDLRQTHLGEHHPDYAQSLHGLAMIYQAQGKLDEAGPLFREAVRVTEAALGETSPVTLRLVHSLGLYEQASGDSRRAEEHLCKARDQLAAMLGDSSPVLVPVLSDLGRFYSALGDHLSAERHWRRVSDIHRAAFPANPLLAAQDRVNLALCLRAQDEFAEAEQLVRESLSLLEAERGPQHPELAAGHGLLASLAQARDRYDEAERLFTEALSRTRVALGQGHPAVAMVLVELAGLQVTRGRPEDALTTYQQARDLFRRAQLEEHAESVNVMRLQGALLQSLGRVAEAEQVFLHRLTILRRLFGADGPGIVPALQLLADVYRLQGKLEQAQQTCEEALAILRKSEAGQGGEWEQNAGPGAVMGPAAGRLALALAGNNLATMFLARGRADDAEPLLRQAAEEAADSVGEDHPAYPGLVVNLAAAHAAAGRLDDALLHLTTLASIDRRLLTQMLTLAGDRHRAMACHAARDHFELYLSAAVKQGLAGVGADARRELLDLVLQRERFGIEALAAPAAEVWGRKYPDQAAELRLLWKLDRQIATKRSSGPGFEGQPRHAELITGWLDQRDATEQRLAAHVPELARRRRLREADTASASAALAPGWALVEMVRFRARELAWFALPGSPGAEAERYLACVLRAGEAAPDVVELGLANEVDALVPRWRAELEGGPPGAGAAFHNRVWASVAPRLTGCRGLVLALDGELLHLPLAALPLPGGAILSDRFELRQVLSCRDLIYKVGEAGGQPLVLGRQQADPGATEPGLSRLWGGLRRFASRRPAEADDLHEVERLLGVTRRPAVPGALAGAPAPRIAHLAAPTFFRPESPGHLTDTGWENPLVCSGLILEAGRELTALEVTTLDLWSTLVVLPDCVTPAGQPGLWPKLRGLVSAYLQAGARGVLLSLWPAPPAARRELLTAFYQSLAERRSPAESLRLAQEAVRCSQPSPRAWAGWVLIGGGRET